MTTNESWIYQGRQGHGYFGNGTAPGDDDDSGDDASANDLFRPANAGQRVDYVASSLIAHVPRNDRGRWTSAVSDSARANLETAAATWYGARSLSRDTFRTQLLDPYTSGQLELPASCSWASLQSSLAQNPVHLSRILPRLGR